MPLISELTPYRAGMGNLLAELIGAVGEIELWLDVDIESPEGRTRALIDDDPTIVYRFMCALLLRNAKETQKWSSNSRSLLLASVSWPS